MGLFDFMNGIGSQIAAGQQVAAGKQAQGVIGQQYGVSSDYMDPYYQAGKTTLGNMSGMVNNNQFSTPINNYQDPGFQFQKDPGYDFRMQQGMNVVNQNSAAQGLSLSGANQRAMQNYAQGFASNEMGNAFNRYNTNRNFGYQQGIDQYQQANQQQMQRYNQMNGLAGMGMQAGNSLANMSTGYGENMAQIYGQMGNARAAGTMGAFNGMTGSLNGGSQLAMMPVGMSGGGGMGSMGGMGMGYGGMQQPMGYGSMGYQPYGSMGGMGMGYGGMQQPMGYGSMGYQPYGSMGGMGMMNGF